MIVDSIHIGDFKQTDDVYDEGVAVTVIFSRGEVAQLLTEYVPDTATTPGITTCRPLVRIICAKLLDFTSV